MRRQPLGPHSLIVGGPMSDAATLERLAVHLKGMRSGLEQYRTGHRSGLPDALQRWSRLLDRYDRALVEAAVLLDLRVPNTPSPTAAVRRRLTPDGRRHLEKALSAAGIELESS